MYVCICTWRDDFVMSEAHMCFPPLVLGGIQTTIKIANADFQGNWPIVYTSKINA